MRSERERGREKESESEEMREGGKEIERKGELKRILNPQLSHFIKIEWACNFKEPTNCSHPILPILILQHTGYNS